MSTQNGNEDIQIENEPDRKSHWRMAYPDNSGTWDTSGMYTEAEITDGRCTSRPVTRLD